VPWEEEEEAQEEVLEMHILQTFGLEAVLGMM